MLIRNQDKTSIVNFKNVDSIWCKNEYSNLFVIACGIVGQEAVLYLGKYKTQEKALSVLDEIQELYLSYMVSEGIDITYGFNQPKVYEMPQDIEE